IGGVLISVANIYPGSDVTSAGVPLPRLRLAGGGRWRGVVRFRKYEDGLATSNLTPKSAILDGCLIATCWAVRWNRAGPIRLPVSIATVAARPGRRTWAGTQSAQ